MNSEIQKLKHEIKELYSQISIKYEEIKKIQLNCSHGWVHYKYEWQQEHQKCYHCDKTRWKECPWVMTPTIGFASFNSTIRHTDGWYYP